MEPIHTLANGFGAYNGVVFIGGDNLVAKWYYETRYEVVKGGGGTSSQMLEARLRHQLQVLTKKLMDMALVAMVVLFHHLRSRPRSWSVRPSRLIWQLGT